ncbi:hypothetical protein K488DRAFT_67596 [Vararia minispora EC-137]|uniref:Uncharacterized protein n=1 Tax=Vararia minispora EC-137 TaxID=1314806 RepID=A0ACB8QXN2_9AGAM|nr:hypothetical protein K488DRAFT_67596 [Vararia minispora EC-137]
MAANDYHRAAERVWAAMRGIQRASFEDRVQNADTFVREVPTASDQYNARRVRQENKLPRMPFIHQLSLLIASCKEADEFLPLKFASEIMKASGVPSSPRWDGDLGPDQWWLRLAEGSSSLSNSSESDTASPGGASAPYSPAPTLARAHTLPSTLPDPARTHIGLRTPSTASTATLSMSLPFYKSSSSAPSTSSGTSPRPNIPLLSSATASFVRPPSTATRCSSASSSSSAVPRHPEVFGTCPMSLPPRPYAFIELTSSVTTPAPGSSIAASPIVPGHSTHHGSATYSGTPAPATSLTTTMRTMAPAAAPDEPSASSASAHPISPSTRTASPSASLAPTRPTVSRDTPAPNDSDTPSESAPSDANPSLGPSRPGAPDPVRHEAPSPPELSTRPVPAPDAHPEIGAKREMPNAVAIETSSMPRSDSASSAPPQSPPLTYARPVQITIALSPRPSPPPRPALPAPRPPSAAPPAYVPPPPRPRPVREEQGAEGRYVPYTGKPGGRPVREWSEAKWREWRNAGPAWYSRSANGASAWVEIGARREAEASSRASTASPLLSRGDPAMPAGAGEAASDRSSETSGRSETSGEKAESGREGSVADIGGSAEGPSEQITVPGSQVELNPRPALAANLPASTSEGRTTETTRASSDAEHAPDNDAQPLSHLHTQPASPTPQPTTSPRQHSDPAEGQLEPDQATVPTPSLSAPPPAYDPATAPGKRGSQQQEQREQSPAMHLSSHVSTTPSSPEPGSSPMATIQKAGGPSEPRVMTSSSDGLSLMPSPSPEENAPSTSNVGPPPPYYPPPAVVPSQEAPSPSPAPMHVPAIPPPAHPTHAPHPTTPTPPPPPPHRAAPWPPPHGNAHPTPYYMPRVPYALPQPSYVLPLMPYGPPPIVPYWAPMPPWAPPADGQSGEAARGRSRVRTATPHGHQAHASTYTLQLGRPDTPRVAASTSVPAKRMIPDESGEEDGDGAQERRVKPRMQPLRECSDASASDVTERELSDASLHGLSEVPPRGCSDAEDACGRCLATGKPCTSGTSKRMGRISGREYSACAGGRVECPMAADEGTADDGGPIAAACPMGLASRVGMIALSARGANAGACACAAPSRLARLPGELRAGGHGLRLHRAEDSIAPPPRSSRLATGMTRPGADMNDRRPLVWPPVEELRGSVAGWEARGAVRGAVPVGAPRHASWPMVSRALPDADGRQRVAVTSTMGAQSVVVRDGALQAEGCFSPPAGRGGHAECDRIIATFAEAFTAQQRQIHALTEVVTNLRAQMQRLGGAGTRSRRG